MSGGSGADGPPPSNLIEPPAELMKDKYAEKVWKDLAPHLIATGMLTGLERYLFVEYCKLVGTALKYEEILTTKGEWIQTTNNGVGNIRKEVTLRNQAWDRSREIAPLLGIGFKSRANAEMAQLKLQNDRIRANTVTGQPRPSGSKPTEETTPQNAAQSAAFADFDALVNR